MRLTICIAVGAVTFAGGALAQVSAPATAGAPGTVAAPAPTPPPAIVPAPVSPPNATMPAPATASDGAAGLSLHLICRGTGEHKVVNFSSAFSFFGRHNASAFGVGTQQSQFEEQMDIDVSGGRVRVRVPRRFLPAFHGGDGGWFDVGELVIGDDAITGKVNINFASHPNIRVDRRTGSVALDGKVGSFAGQCEKVDPNARAF